MELQYYLEYLIKRMNVICLKEKKTLLSTETSKIETSLCNLFTL